MILLKLDTAPTIRAMQLSMETTPMDPTDSQDAWQLRFDNALNAFGLALLDLHHTNPWPDLPAVDKAVRDIATALWTHGFSQTEIRKAYESALTVLPTYTAGEEARS